VGINKVVDSQTLSSNVLSKYAEKKRRKLAGESVFGVPSGYYFMDRLTGGWQDTDLIIIAGRPSMGKTSFALANMLNAAKRGHGVLFHSLEMDKEQIVQRLFAMEKEISYEKFRDTTLTDEEERQLNAFANYFATLPFFIDDTGGVSAQYIQDTTERYVREYGIKMVVVDYLQQMAHSTDRRAKTIDTVGDASSGLKNVAKANKVPVIALSQLSRNVEQRPDKKPIMSDLRESGKIEQDADLICFLYRPEYYKILEDEEGRDTTGVAQIIVAKHRNGALDTIPLFFDARYASFKELSERPENYGAVAPNSSPDQGSFDEDFLEALVTPDKLKFD